MTPRDPIAARTDIARQLAAARDIDVSRFIPSAKLRSEADELVEAWRQNPGEPSCRLDELCIEALAADAAKEADRRRIAADRLAMMEAQKAAEPQPDPGFRRLLLKDEITGARFWLKVAVENLEVISTADVHNQSRAVPKGRPIGPGDSFGAVFPASGGA